MKPESTSFPGLHQEQWAILMGQLKTNKTEERMPGKKSFNNGIVDYGASHHMTGNIELLTEVQEISP